VNFDYVFVDFFLCFGMDESKVDAYPFGNYEITDWKVLESMDGRSSCPKCGKSRKYFCYTCYVPVAELEGKIPKMKVDAFLKINLWFRPFIDFMYSSASHQSGHHQALKRN